VDVCLSDVSARPSGSTKAKGKPDPMGNMATTMTNVNAMGGAASPTLLRIPNEITCWRCRRTPLIHPAAVCLRPCPSEQELRRWRRRGQHRALAFYLRDVDDIADTIMRQRPCVWDKHKGYVIRLGLLRRLLDCGLPSRLVRDALDCKCRPLGCKRLTEARQVLCETDAVSIRSALVEHLMHVPWLLIDVCMMYYSTNN